jgi:hypothetical protein
VFSCTVTTTTQDVAGCAGTLRDLSYATPAPQAPEQAHHPDPGDKRQKRQNVLSVVPELLLTVADVAARLSVHRETVYRLVARASSRPCGWGQSCASRRPRWRPISLGRRNYGPGWGRTGRPDNARCRGCCGRWKGLAVSQRCPMIGRRGGLASRNRRPATLFAARPG